MMLSGYLKMLTGKGLSEGMAIRLHNDMVRGAVWGTPQVELLGDSGIIVRFWDRKMEQPEVDPQGELGKPSWERHGHVMDVLTEFERYLYQEEGR